MKRDNRCLLELDVGPRKMEGKRPLRISYNRHDVSDAGSSHANQFISINFFLIDASNGEATIESVDKLD